MLLVYFITEYGSHTGEQYSSMGLTSPLYAVSLTCVVNSHVNSQISMDKITTLHII